jgi:hypothetical protein
VSGATGQTLKNPPNLPMNEGDLDKGAGIVKTAGKISALIGALALLAFPATGLAKKGEHGKHGKHGKHANQKAKSCAKLHTVGYQVGGTLVSMTADDPATTDTSEATVTLTVTSANSHARNSGELEDQNADRKGNQVKGATYTIPAGDAFVMKLGDDGALVPAAGDRVKVKGRIAVTKKRCAAEGATADDRFATPDVTRVKVSPAEAETGTEDETGTETETPENEAETTTAAKVLTQ